MRQCVADGISHFADLWRANPDSNNLNSKPVERQYVYYNGRDVYFPHFRMAIHCFTEYPAPLLLTSMSWPTEECRLTYRTMWVSVVCVWVCVCGVGGWVGCYWAPKWLKNTPAHSYVLANRRVPINIQNCDFLCDVCVCVCVRGCYTCASAEMVLQCNLYAPINLCFNPFTAIVSLENDQWKRKIWNP